MAGRQAGLLCFVRQHYPSRRLVCLCAPTKIPPVKKVLYTHCLGTEAHKTETLPCHAINSPKKAVCLRQMGTVLSLSEAGLSTKWLKFDTQCIRYITSRALNLAGWKAFGANNPPFAEWLMLYPSQAKIHPREEHKSGRIPCLVRRERLWNLETVRQRWRSYHLPHGFV
jgi:hypothetical protein